jgi:hypothetical protein
LFQGKVDLDLPLLSLISSLEPTWGSFVVNLLPLACFLIFKQFRSSGWLQREYSLIHVSNLISNCMRWLIQNLDLIWPYFPFPLPLRRHNSVTPYTWLIEMTCPPFWVTSGSLGHQPPKHCIVVAFPMKGSTQVTYSRSQVQAGKYSLIYIPTPNNKNHKIQQDPLKTNHSSIQSIIDGAISRLTHNR